MAMATTSSQSKNNWLFGNAKPSAPGSYVVKLGIKNNNDIVIPFAAMSLRIYLKTALTLLF